ncbi:hypothetical protein MNBD_GAMMA21-2503 [hydrothermal vent metagenome]|uniref:DUF3592 domain-containing protein n=1 Tax=hydrothermal vent metagenome TaxID=652676 RepID=A0A3B1AD11_9ZZZZ
MKFLLNIALGKSVYTVYFFIIMTAAIILAYYFESKLTINLALSLVSILGIFIIISAVVSSSEAVDSSGWPKIKAKLGICKVSVSGLSVGNTGATTYQPTIQYSFDVNNQTYYGNSYILGERTYNRPAVVRIINDIKSNKDDFTISYNPVDPSMNVVKPGLNAVHYIRALVGAAIAVFTVFELSGWSNYI